MTWKQGIIRQEGAWKQRLALASVILALLPCRQAWPQQPDPPRLGITPSPPGPWVRLDAMGPTNQVYELEGSSDLLSWESAATTHDGLVRYPDSSSAHRSRRFYRLKLRAKTETDDWKHQILFPADRFQSPQLGLGLDEIRWVKFAILLEEPDRVVFQDSRKYVFHYDFATERMPPFLGMNPAEFDRVSLYRQGQAVLLGTVLYPPPPNGAEYGIQFVGVDPYPPEQIRDWFELVRAIVAAPPGVQALYVPTFEQLPSAQTNRDYFAAHNITVSSTARWLRGNQCYAPGWALGRLKFFVGSSIEPAYRTGLLAPGDILLTDAVPAEIPLLAGVICLTPSTPNSHVAILSRSVGAPFVYLADAALQAQAQAWVGRKVCLRVTALFEQCKVTLIDLENELTPSLEEEILGLKRPDPLNFPLKTLLGAYSAPVDALHPEDARYFGGKAAHYGLLRREIPDDCPPAIAFSFDLWDAFLDQPMPGGGTLRTTLSNLLSRHTYPPDMAALKGDLEDAREWITVTAAFSPELQTAITNALRVFDPARKIRFRSSTNFEDTEQSVGAGLYDSYSGCLLDDLDGDFSGPSRCDPTQDSERGVFRAIKKVYASFYNDNAFLERLRRGVDESQVGMGILVHHSFPDELELANGVATMDISASVSPPRLTGDMVTQQGALPVTNPDGSALPEVVNASRYSFGTYFSLQQRSSLVPLGGYVLDWQNDYQQFVSLFARIAQGYALEFPAKQRFLLDFEYKKMADDGLVIKQVRELPLPGTTNSVIPFLLNQSNQFAVFQGEYGDVFGNHRLKSHWMLRTASLRLTETNRAQHFYADARWEFVDGSHLGLLTGPPSSWPQASHAVSPDEIMDRWALGEETDRRHYELLSIMPGQVPGSDPPVFTLADWPLYLKVHYATPQPTLDYQGLPVLTTNEVVQLQPLPATTANLLRQERALTNHGITLHITFDWPEEPVGVVAGYTAPLAQWEETTITGLTSTPLTLRSHYSQTYRPGHHNFTEDFIFEPRLEPDLDQALLEELETKNFRLLHVSLGFIEPRLTILGLDGKFRSPDEK